MVKLHTGLGTFEYTGCNKKVTVEQLKAYLRFNGITYGSKILKKDLCQIVNKVIRYTQQIKQGKDHGSTWNKSQIQQQKKKRLRTKVQTKSQLSKKKQVSKKKTSCGCSN